MDKNTQDMHDEIAYDEPKRSTLLEQARALPQRRQTIEKLDDEMVELIWAWLTGTINQKQVQLVCGVKNASLGMFLASNVKQMAMSGMIAPPEWIKGSRDDDA